MTARMAHGSGTGSSRSRRTTRQVRARWRAAAVLAVGVAAAHAWAQDAGDDGTEGAARTVAVNETLSIALPRPADDATPTSAGSRADARAASSAPAGAEESEPSAPAGASSDAAGTRAPADEVADSAAVAAAESAAAAAEAPGRFRETQALGLPRGPLLDAATEAAQGDANLARTIDPRRNEMVRVLLALLVVIGLIFAVRIAMRRAAGVLGGGARPAGVLEVLARYPISRGQWLLLLRMGQRIVLLHQGSQGIRTLAEVTDPSEVATLLGRMEAGARASEAAQFRRTLRNFEAEHERMHGSASQGEIVDLTRRRRPPRALFGRRAVG